MTSTLEALQTTLAAEHAAVWTFGTLGGQTSASGEPDLYALVSVAYAVHRSRRDQLIGAIRDLGVEPVAAAVAYDLSNDVSTPAKVTAAALEIETGATAVYADLVASTYGDQRRWAITALTESAVRELGFGGGPETFPGMTELANR